LAGAIGHDIYGRWLRPEASQQARSRAFRLAAVVAGVLGAALGLLVGGFDISILVGWAFAIAASSFFPLLVLGIWWRGLSTVGAAVGASVGGAVATVGIVTTMVGSTWEPLGALLREHAGLAVILAQPAIVTIPLAFAIMVWLSRVYPADLAAASAKMVQMHVPERLGLRRDYIPE
jgi:Na+(H+)/acetate symporter ActP